MTGGLCVGYQRWMKFNRRTSKSENVQRLSNKNSNPQLVRSTSTQSSKPNFFATGNLETHMSLRRDSLRNLALTLQPLKDQGNKLEQVELYGFLSDGMLLEIGHIGSCRRRRSASCFQTMRTFKRRSHCSTQLEFAMLTCSNP